MPRETAVRSMETPTSPLAVQRPEFPIHWGEPSSREVLDSPPLIKLQQPAAIQAKDLMGCPQPAANQAKDPISQVHSQRLTNIISSQLSQMTSVTAGRLPATRQ
ncbi:unnamed protein product [Polarella glacialis]|uniref:Uncharacterized protein n=1 Tax=Polarella glacialis TaxID=89957 RepID=A0A813F172_POLGL|nr:unnamed protein product [Polarella glacialis]